MTKKEYAKRLESLGYDFKALTPEQLKLINDCYTIQNVNEDIGKRIQKFKDQITEFWRNNKEEYSKAMYIDFFEYWSEHGDNDKRFRKEKETSFSLSRRLKTWARNSKEFSKNNNRMPDVWNQKYANSLTPEKNLEYYKHLTSLGFKRVRIGNSMHFDWIKE